MIPVGIKSDYSRWWKVNAYLDSGAFYSIFDDSVADLLSINLTDGQKMTAVVGDGDRMPFYLHTVSLQIGRDQIRMQIGFSRELKVGFNILGLDLFDRYEVTFNNKRKTISMKPY